MIRKGISESCGKQVTDAQIMYLVGVVTYTYLQRRYPCLYQRFEECNTVYDNCEGNIPPYILHKVSETDPYKLKEYLVELISCCNLDDNPVSILVGSSAPPKCPLMERKQEKCISCCKFSVQISISVLTWMLISAIMVILIILALFTIYNCSLCSSSSSSSSSIVEQKNI